MIRPVRPADAPLPLHGPRLRAELDLRGREPFPSARLREALAPDERASQWLAVDSDDCTPAFRAADYRFMDRARSTPGPFDDVTLADGSTDSVWSASPYQPGGPLPRFSWHGDFRLLVQRLRAPGIGWTLATDALADRVIRADLDDVVITNVENDGTRKAEPGMDHRHA